MEDSLLARYSMDRIMKSLESSLSQFQERKQVVAVERQRLQVC